MATEPVAIRDADGGRNGAGDGGGDAARPDGGRSLAHVRAFGFDLDGTIYLEDRLLPGARELLELLAGTGVPYVFATNNSSRSAASYVERLRALELPADRGRVLTSNDVAAAYLLRHGYSRPYLVASDEVADEYRRLGLAPTDEEPDCVLLTFDRTLTYEKLRIADRLIRRGTPYLATHADRVCPTPEGPIPDCGAFIELLAASTGASPRVLGKPHEPMATALLDRLGTPAAQVAFVGDRLYTDVRLANQHGLFAVLALTGEARREDLRSSVDRPDLVVGSLADLLDMVRDEVPRLRDLARDGR